MPTPKVKPPAQRAAEARHARALRTGDRDALSGRRKEGGLPKSTVYAAYGLLSLLGLGILFEVLRLMFL